MKFKDKLRNKLKSFIKDTQHKKKRKMAEINQLPFKMLVLNWIHRLLVVIFRCIYQYFLGRGKSMPPIKNLILTESATSLAHKIRTRKLTSVQVLQSFIDRIAEVNPLLNCVVDERYKEAMQEAADIDKLIASGKLTEEELARDKPFLGVPISTKDCISVEGELSFYDGIELCITFFYCNKGLLFTSGLIRRRNIRAEKDSDVIALMRQAGAIPFALTNVSECCMWWESDNKVHGKTNNPYDTNRIVGGSSGGEGTGFLQYSRLSNLFRFLNLFLIPFVGCIQAAAASPFGIGSDIGGSIRMPAFFNGIFGHKPSKFIVSNIGQYPEAVTTEHNSFLGTGPMCRYACDLKPMLQILADKNATSLYLDDPVDLKNVKFYYQDCDGGAALVTPVDPDLKQALDKVVKHLRNTVKAEVKKVAIPALRQSAPIWFAGMRVKESIDFDVQLANFDGKINVWWELLKLLFGQSNHTFIALLTCITERYGVQYGTEKHSKLLETKRQLYQEFKDMLGNDGVFLYPTHPTAAPYHTEPIVRAFNFSYTAIFNTLGLPATAIPLGLGLQGLPLGIQAIGGMNQDRLTLAVACELERAFGGWVPPEIQV